MQEETHSHVDYYFLDGFFTNETPEKYSCPICLSPVQREAFLTQCCGSHFCLHCVLMAARGGPCPMCKGSPLVVFPNKERQREINVLQVRCPTQLVQLDKGVQNLDGGASAIDVSLTTAAGEDSHDDVTGVGTGVASTGARSCDWKGELGQVDRHLQSQHRGDRRWKACCAELSEEGGSTAAGQQQHLNHGMRRMNVSSRHHYHSQSGQHHHPHSGQQDHPQYHHSQSGQQDLHVWSRGVPSTSDHDGRSLAPSGQGEMPDGDISVTGYPVSVQAHHGGGDPSGRHDVQMMGPTQGMMERERVDPIGRQDMQNNPLTSEPLEPTQGMDRSGRHDVEMINGPGQLMTPRVWHQSEEENSTYQPPSTHSGEESHHDFPPRYSFHGPAFRPGNWRGRGDGGGRPSRCPAAGGMVRHCGPRPLHCRPPHHHHHHGPRHHSPRPHYHEPRPQHHHGPRHHHGPHPHHHGPHPHQDQPDEELEHGPHPHHHHGPHPHHHHEHPHQDQPDEPHPHSDQHWPHPHHGHRGHRSRHH